MYIKCFADGEEFAKLLFLHKTLNKVRVNTTVHLVHKVCPAQDFTFPVKNKSRKIIFKHAHLKSTVLVDGSCLHFSFS